MNRAFLLFTAVLAAVLSNAPVLADGSEEYYATKAAWSSFWFPYIDGTLVTGKASSGTVGGGYYYTDWEGGFAPLEKLGAAFGLDPRGEAFQWESEHHYDTEAEEWYGHCNGFAAASCVEAAPTAPGQVGDVYFRVGDKKALLCESHQGDGALLTGSRFTGAEGEDSQDIYPNVFHAVLQRNIKTLGVPFVVEVDPGIQIWNFPCYGYSSTWIDDGDVRHVTTKVYLASDVVRPDVTEIKKKTATYTYDLKMSGETVLSGTWTGKSVYDHPDFVWEVITIESANPYLTIDDARNVASSTLAGSVTDDSWEPNNSRQEAEPMNYDVLFARLLDDDWFGIPVEAGEKVSATVMTQKIDNQLSVSLEDAQGNPLAASQSGKGPFTLSSDVVENSGNAYLHLDPVTPQTVFRNYEIEVGRTGCQAVMPHVANSCQWSSELFLLNPNATSVRVFNHFYDASVSPVRHVSYDGGIGTMPGKALIRGYLETLFNDFGEDCQRWMRLRSLENIDGFCLFRADGGKNLTAVRLQSPVSTNLNFNSLAYDSTWWTGVGIVNPDYRHTTKVQIKPIRASGSVNTQAVKEVVLEPSGRVLAMLNEYFDLDVLAETNWIRIEADRPIAGFEVFGTQNFEMCEGLPLQDDGAAESYAAWLPPPTDGWWSGITLVNPSSDTVSVKVYPFNVNGIYLLNPPYYTEVPLGRRGKSALMMEQLLPGGKREQLAYLKIAVPEDRKVTGFVMNGNFQSGIMCGYPLTKASEMQTQGTICAVDGLTVIFNNVKSGNSDKKVTIRFLDTQGNALGEEREMALPRYVVKRATPEELYQGTPPEGWARLVWKCDSPLIVMGEVIQDDKGTYIPSLVEEPAEGAVTR